MRSCQDGKYVALLRAISKFANPGRQSGTARNLNTVARLAEMVAKL
jgi:hypothetical protein